MTDDTRRNPTMYSTAIVLACAAALLAIPPARACDGIKPEFRDDYRELDESWSIDPSSDAVTVDEGKLKLKPSSASNFTLLYGGMKFTDVDVCVTVRVPNLFQSAHDLSAGVVFWAQDYSNFYVLLISGDGRATLQRVSHDHWVSMVDWTYVAAAKAGPGAENRLRVVTGDDRITAYINGAEFATAQGLPTTLGGEVGLHAESEWSRRDTWKFSAFAVRDPSLP